MKFNHYTIAALPQLSWDSDLPCTLAELLEEFDMQLEPLKDGISRILLLDDLKNMELLIKSKLDPSENADPAKIDFYRAGLTKPEEIELFIEDPRRNAPDYYPEFIEDFFEERKTSEERSKYFEELYISYYRWIAESKNRFLARYGGNMLTLCTVISAIRMMKSGADLDKNLKGDGDAVKIILENRNNADLGLKGYFPEVVDVVALFDKSKTPDEVEKELDRIRFNLLEEVGQEKPFADHIIYGYIIGFQMKDRWMTQSDEAGMEILENIIKGNY